MEAFWSFFVLFGRWFGLAVAVLSIFFGFFVLGLMIGHAGWAIFMMIQVWIIGIWMGLLLIVLSQIADNTKRP